MIKRLQGLKEAIQCLLHILSIVDIARQHNFKRSYLVSKQKSTTTKIPGFRTHAWLHPNITEKFLTGMLT